MSSQQQKFFWEVTAVDGEVLIFDVMQVLAYAPADSVDGKSCVDVTLADGACRTIFGTIENMKKTFTGVGIPYWQFT